MIPLVLIALAAIGGVLLAIGIAARLRGMSVMQGLYYAPLKLLFRISNPGYRALRTGDRNVIYVVAYQSRVDAALMLSLLPDDTLHILDERSARTAWLEPWRELARTIAFNPSHVFFSRRLVRRLRGGGRLAVYLPAAVEPDKMTFSLYRAVARIAAKADAAVVPVVIDGSASLPFALAGHRRARLFPKLTIMALEPKTIAQLAATGRPSTRPSLVLFDRMAEAHIAAIRPRSAFAMLRNSALFNGPSRIVVSDGAGHEASYRQTFREARALGQRFAEIGAGRETLGLLLSGGPDGLAALLGMLSAARPAALLEPETALPALRAADLRDIVSSRAFVEGAGLGDTIAAIEAAGAKLWWIEDMRRERTMVERLQARLLWRSAVLRAGAHDQALALFSRRLDGSAEGIVLSHGDLVMNLARIARRLAITPDDRVLVPLASSSGFGLMLGRLLPLVRGAHHVCCGGGQAAQIARRFAPTVLVADNAAMALLAPTIADGHLGGIRKVLAGPGRVNEEVLEAWAALPSALILDIYAPGEAGPLVALNTLLHREAGTVGRLLPAIHARIDPVDGLPEGGRLRVVGSNFLSGVILPDSAGRSTLPPDSGLDTGDLAAFTRDGYLRILGPATRTAIVGGRAVSLDRVEICAAEARPEAEHSAVAFPDSGSGHRVGLATTATDFDGDALSEKTGAGSILVVALARLPRLDSGAVDREAVERLVIQEADRAEAA